jgi:hypothetical protein
MISGPRSPTARLPASPARSPRSKSSAKSSASARGWLGKLLMTDARSLRFETLRYRWNSENPLSGASPTIRDLSAAAR